MDNETLDRLGATPLADGLKRIADINTPSDLFTELARLHVEDVRCVRDKRVRRFCVPGGVANHRLCLHSVLFYFGSRIDPDQPNINIAALGQVNLTALTRLSLGTNQYGAGDNQAGLGLPDRQYYLGDDEASVALRLKYTEHMQKLFQLTRYVDPSRTRGHRRTLPPVAPDQQPPVQSNRNTAIKCSARGDATREHLHPPYRSQVPCPFPPCIWRVRAVVRVRVRGTVCHAQSLGIAGIRTRPTL